ncbi:hypothetical protein [Georgenia sp. H159]|uniref:hypothetical protein n=1 Tax=Georgenia sp. H159 TaxID=3076115 RepID=UPI002D791685|nr:hypothetical protein [Georgenia sp. H159]
MDTYDSAVRLARAVRTGDFLVGVDRTGEHLVEVRDVSHDRGQVTIVTSEQTVTLDARDAVRVAHPDVPALDPTESTSQTNAR